MLLARRPGADQTHFSAFGRRAQFIRSADTARRALQAPCRTSSVHGPPGLKLHGRRQWNDRIRYSSR
ncbi:hypothetical protein DF012_31610 [Burkholderia ubonensis]|uniref:Uncharacterized protein n=1 Tax=Burkholderia ubonensis TaxID=101571 RepID=A0AB74D2P7_9BURK|nr:hypothetical protein DF015_32275 [Burkholderia ubonensis]RQP85892.1 hypothetical protein DF012_31610 [Burkholderia ubonensis]